MLMEMHKSHSEPKISSDELKNGRFCTVCGGMIIFADYNFVCSECGLIYVSETASNDSFLNESREIIRQKNGRQNPETMKMRSATVYNSTNFARLFNLEKFQENTVECRCFNLIDGLRTIFPITELMWKDLEYYAKKIPTFLFKRDGRDKIYYYEVVLTTLGYILKIEHNYDPEAFISRLTKNFNVKFSLGRYRYVLSQINHLPALKPIFKNDPQTVVEDFYAKIRACMIKGVSTLEPEKLRAIASCLVEHSNDISTIDPMDAKMTLVDLSFKAIEKIGYKNISNYDVSVLSAVGIFMGGKKILSKQYVSKMFGICRGTINNRITDFGKKMKLGKTSLKRNSF